jgi:hypothetical protein
MLVSVAACTYIHVHTHVELLQVHDTHQGDIVVLRMLILVVACAYMHTCMYTREIVPST